MEDRYIVRWVIEVWDTSPRAAAEQARKIQLDPDNLATMFEVSGDDDEGRVMIDLSDEE